MCRVHRAHRAQTLCPSSTLGAPLARQDAQGCAEHPFWIPGRGETPSQAPVGGSVPQGGSGLWNRGGSQAPSGMMPQRATACAAPLAFLGPRGGGGGGGPASSASAPGVPGGSAPAQAVAPLPGAVDEAQGILELLAGGFLGGLVGEVHLCGGREGVCEGFGPGPRYPGAPREPWRPSAPRDQEGAACPRFCFWLWPQMRWRAESCPFGPKCSGLSQSCWYSAVPRPLPPASVPHRKDSSPRGSGSTPRGPGWLGTW